MLYITETVEWLRDAQDQRGGAWGVYYRDTQHATITGEVVSALRDQLTPDLKDTASKCLQTILGSAGADFTGVRSIAHLCWIVEGALNVGIELGDLTIQRFLEELRNSSQRDGWGWQLGVRGGSEAAVYPTLLATRVFRHVARLSGRETNIAPSVPTWLGARIDPAPEVAECVVKNAYAIQALCLLGRSDIIRDSDIKAMTSACARLAPDEVFYREAVSLDGESAAFDWSHSALQQVLLATMAFNPRLVEEDPCPQLFSRVFAESINNGNWYDPSKKTAAPYVAGDSMALMSRWRRRIVGTDGDSRILRLLGEERIAKEEASARAAAEAALAGELDVVPVEPEVVASEAEGQSVGAGVWFSLAWVEFWTFWCVAVVVLLAWLKWPDTHLTERVPRVLLALTIPAPAIPGMYQGLSGSSRAVKVISALAAWGTLAALIGALLRAFA